MSAPSRERVPIVIAGHVDHGKSTVIGRLLADTGSLPDGKLEQVRALCERTARPFEYAFLLDALKDERDQGITIDTARVLFRTPRRDYVILDAPGHVEFLKNMVTGASRADAALLVIDAGEGVRENSRRHGYLLSLLGVRQIAVVVNKMDLVGWSAEAFGAIEREYRGFLAGVGLTPSRVIPVSARDGENVSRRSAKSPWYDGPSVLEALEEFTPAETPVALPLRLPVQDVYKFTSEGDDRRIVAGTVETGTLRAGDEVVFYPSGKRSRVRSIETFGPASGASVAAGQAAGFTLADQIYVARGEIAVRAGEDRPAVTTRLRVNLFWLGKSPLTRRTEYVLRLGTARTGMRVEQIHRVLDADTLAPSEQQTRVDRHQVAECTLQLLRAIACDPSDAIGATGRFVIVDDYEIRGGGIVREALPDRQSSLREKVLLRNYKWESSFIPPERRAERWSQRAALLLLTGPREIDKKRVAKELEARLFADGRVVYFLGIGNVLYGVDADLDREKENRREHIRRLAEVANLLLDAGMILIVTAGDLGPDDLELIRTTVDSDRISTVWIGDEVTTGLTPDLTLDPRAEPQESAERLRGFLQELGVIFRPW